MPKLTKNERLAAEQLGGSDFDDWREYSENTNLAYFDTRHHFERSAHFSPQHEVHRDKVESLQSREP
jgi:hypothetical protein